VEGATFLQIAIAAKKLANELKVPWAVTGQGSEASTGEGTDSLAKIGRVA
jgi:hypothetical protein